MSYTVYIQSINNFPIDHWAVSAYQGFRGKQMDIVFFEKIEEVPVSKQNIVVASIENTNAYFEKLGLPPKKAINIPDELSEYAGRNIDYVTMQKFRHDTIAGVQKLPIFIKSANRAKQFIAGVMSKKETIHAFDDVDNKEVILLSEVVDFVSEYRCYVYDKQLKGVHWYMGDFKQFIDCSVVEKAIRDYKSQPAGYTIDFGLTSDGRTLLIECNDGWSIGNYGFSHDKYATLLTKRWLQLMQSV